MESIRRGRAIHFRRPKFFFPHCKCKCLKITQLNANLPEAKTDGIHPPSLAET